jgi:ABC-type nitrate/sulfonate/bicarbonate transport system permease component
VLPACTTLGVLACWEVLTRSGVLPQEVPAITTILDWLSAEVQTTRFWSALGDTLLQWGAGLAVGGAAGIAVGVAFGVSRPLQQLFQVAFEFLRPIPAVVYLPLLLLIMGARSEVAIWLAGVGAFWPLLFQAYYGIRAVDPVARETGLVFGLSRLQVLRSITLPSILPYVATGVRIASSLALVVTVSVELISAVPGLGRNLSVYAVNGVYPGVYGLILACGVLGLSLNAVLERAERSLLHWHSSQRQIGA